MIELFPSSRLFVGSLNLQNVEMYLIFNYKLRMSRFTVGEQYVYFKYGWNVFINALVDGWMKLVEVCVQN